MLNHQLGMVWLLPRKFFSDFRDTTRKELEPTRGAVRVRLSATPDDFVRRGAIGRRTGIAAAEHPFWT